VAAVPANCPGQAILCRPIQHLPSVSCLLHARPAST
jgi:hypothetical protein